ncbi:MAG: hypothetical protein IPM32_07145 [Ignavibacteriae bacterium]|nr:hypothetical protein [Ignavibacteriota bacterium]
MKKLILIIFVLMNLNLQLFAQDAPKVNSSNKISELNSLNQPIISYSTEKLLTNSIIIIEFLLLVMILFYWKKSRNNSRNNYNKNFKKNIEALRNEKLTFTKNKIERKKIKLFAKVIKGVELDSAIVNKKARELNIGKGEILLAARIHKLSQQIG